MPPSIRKAQNVALSQCEPEEIDRRIAMVCEAIGAFIGYWGFKDILGKIWTLLALSRRPLTQVEIAHFFGVSRALISNSVEELQRYGLVQRVDDRRNAPWTANLDVWPTISDVLRAREWMLLEAVKVALEGALEEAKLNDRKAQEADWDLGRMRLLLVMTDLAQTFLRTLIALRSGQPLGQLRLLLNRSTEFFRNLRSLAS